MRLVRFTIAFGCTGNIDQDTAALDLHGKGGNAVVFEAWFAEAGTAVEFPIVPGADDVFAVEPAIAERPADMVAGICYDAECPVPA